MFGFAHGLLIINKAYKPSSSWTLQRLWLRKGTFLFRDWWRTKSDITKIQDILNEFYVLYEWASLRMEKAIAQVLDWRMSIQTLRCNALIECFIYY